MPDMTEPELKTVQQDYDELAHDIQRVIVPVRVDGPAQVHEMPAKVAVSRYVNTSLTETINVAPEDLRRKYLYVICTQTVYLGHDKTLTDRGEVGQLPAGIILPILTSEAVWCKAVTTAGILSYWLGQWAD